MYNRHMDKKAFFRSGQFHGNRIHGIYAGIVCLIVLSILGSALYFLPCFWAVPKRGYFRVVPSQTGAATAQALQRQGFIQSPGLFRFFLSVTGYGKQIKAGEYALHSQMSMYALVRKLTCGTSDAYEVVIPEGYTVRQIARAVASHGRISEQAFLQAANNDSLLYPYMRTSRPVVFKAEGFLFPDTYALPYTANADEAVRIMLDNFNRKLTPARRQRLQAAHMTVTEWVTLASLVEREAKFQADRQPIAAAFRQRLRIGMKLQSDASISYAMGNHKSTYDITDTQYASPYNTYVFAGLPPGAIGNAGLPCLDAVLQAQPTANIYFVADTRGYNHFAATYAAHQKNVQEYLR